MDLTVFILVFLRVSIILLLMPVFGAPNIPWMVKAGLSLFLSLIVVNTINMNAENINNNLLILMIISDFFIALSIGFMIHFIFDGIQMAGQYMSYQMGFTIVNVIDPVSSSQISIISQFKQLLALFILLAINGHHYFVWMTPVSFKLIPIDKIANPDYLFMNIIKLSSEIFIIALKLSSPIVITMFFANLAMGIIARTMPQINIFILSFPLYIGLGLLLMGLFLPFFAEFVKHLIYQMIGNIYDNLQLLGA